MEEDLQRILQDPAMQKKAPGTYGTFLNESAFRTLDETYYSHDVQASDIVLTESEKRVLTEVYGEDTLLEDTIAKLVNENITIGSKYELLEERIEAESETLLEDRFEKRVNGENTDNKPLYLNGSSIKILDVERIVDLRIDDVCYGYYYAAETSAGLNNVGTMNPNTGRELKNNIQIASNNTLTGVNTVDYTTNNTVAREFNVDESKLKLITDIFVKAISKKIDKSYIRKNKQFKNFIYSLLKQDYIIKKGVKLTYFLPEEVIKFEAPALFRKILFFAKLYLATLSNIILIKLGRAHDKRVFYINVGLDADYEQAI